MAVLKVGLMGLGRGGQRVAEVLLHSSWCELIAVGSSKPERIDLFTSRYPGIAAYNDFRLMIVSNALDALFIAAPPYLRSKYLALAAERGVPVWMLPPPARRFQEAVEILRPFEAAGCPIVVSRSWGVEAALQWDALGLERIGRFFLARANVMLCGEEDLGWRGDLQRAGGGVLLDRAYPVIDCLVQAMGMPGTVYARTSGGSRPSDRSSYDTEDTAGVVCQFPGGGLAVLSASWAAGPAEESLDLYAPDGTVHVDAREVVVRDRVGQTEVSRQSRPENVFRPQIEDFLSELASSPRRMRSTLRQHLPALALIEAAYLSARTGQPESLATIFDIHDVSQQGP